MGGPQYTSNFTSKTVVLFSKVYGPVLFTISQSHDTLLLLSLLSSDEEKLSWARNRKLLNHNRKEEISGVFIFCTRTTAYNETTCDENTEENAELGRRGSTSPGVTFSLGYLVVILLSLGYLVVISSFLDPQIPMEHLSFARQLTEPTKEEWVKVPRPCSKEQTIHFFFKTKIGGVAQWLEHLPLKQKD